MYEKMNANIGGYTSLLSWFLHTQSNYKKSLVEIKINKRNIPGARDIASRAQCWVLVWCWQNLLLSRFLHRQCSCFSRTKEERKNIPATSRAPFVPVLESIRCCCGSGFRTHGGSDMVTDVVLGAVVVAVRLQLINLNLNNKKNSPIVAYVVVKVRMADEVYEYQ